MHTDNGAERTVTPLFGSQSNFHFVMSCSPDKSITHRAIMFAAMAKGSSRIFRPLLGEDCISTINVFRSLGVLIEIVKVSPEDEGLLKVESPGVEGWKSPRDTLDFGNSGTTARLLMGLFSSVPGLNVTCKGDASLSKRPMRRVVEPLRKMGAVIMGASDGEFLPLSIEGVELTAMAHDIATSSAQVKSCLLLAGLNVKGRTTVRLPAGSRDHTEKFLQALEAPLSIEQNGETEVVSITGPFRPRAQDLRIPGDPSSAAFFVVLGVLAPNGAKVTIQDVLVNPTRTGFIAAVEQTGAKVESRNHRHEGFIEPVCDLEIAGVSALQPIQISESMVPTLIDEIPVLAVLAMFANGQSTFCGLSELRVKESDRLARTAELITLAGGKVEVEGDTMRIIGNPNLQVKSFTYDSAGDHRLAMAAAIIAARAINTIMIKDAACVDVSFPDFFVHLEKLR